MKFVVVLLAAVASVSAACTFSQREAEDILKLYGVRASSSGNCTTKTNPRCTSYEGIQCSTVWNLAGLASDTGSCPIVVTGGTEAGHAHGPYSHENGYAVNLRKEQCLKKFIQDNFKKSGGCWKDSLGNQYCERTNRWDVTYYK
ncbi:peptidoglycan-binding domain-containing protein [Ceratobasidium sp. AG-Ba]|nr:peptidoglycan-binding domain-containing protein [Ceratobasidium sp. AG-Ba]